jgi:glycosidase
VTPANGELSSAEGVRGAVFYEIFVRSFADSNRDGKGDLRGLIDHLDYLNDGDPDTGTDLGVDGIWLMPIQPSPSYHGYDVTDYAGVNPDYGTVEDFEELCRQAHRRGIRVVIDWVMNHNSNRHPWFSDATLPSGEHHSWYVWRDSDPGWTQPWGPGRVWHPLAGTYYYGLFGADMPDLNYRSRPVQEEFKRLAALWLRRGVDGFRLDAARYLVEDGPGAGQADTPETHVIWKEFAAAVHSTSPNAILVGENTSSTAEIATYFGDTNTEPTGNELTTNFNFPLADSIVQGVRGGCASMILRTLGDMIRDYPPDVVDAPFLTNHDQVRLATQLDNLPAKLRMAAAILLTLPGAPFIYYGEELGMQNGAPGGDDRLKRTPFAWTGAAGGGFSASQPWQAFGPGMDRANVAAETGDAGSLLSWYRDWIRIRKGSAALRLGTIRPVSMPDTSCQPVLAFTRETDVERALVVHNLGDETTESLGGVAAGRWKCLHCAEGALLEEDHGVVRVHAPAGSSSVWIIPLARH